MLTKSMLYLLIVALVLCSIGFKRFVWFMSVGYGFAIAGIGVALLVIYHDVVTIWEVIMCLLMVVYGIRLGGFLLARELKNKNYKKVLDAQTSSSIPIFVKIVMWLCMGCLYVCQTSPVTYRLDNGAAGGTMAIVGAVIMACGIILEALSDKQKSAAKAVNPNRFCDSGLFKFVRCPNYLGEMIFWTGIFLSGFGAYQGLQWVFSFIGWIMIIYIMISGARRLELRQNKNYGDDPEYQKYVTTVPLIIPFVPLYSLKDVTWLKG